MKYGPNLLSSQNLFLIIGIHFRFLNLLVKSSDMFKKQPPAPGKLDRIPYTVLVGVQ